MKRADRSNFFIRSVAVLCIIVSAIFLVLIVLNCSDLLIFVLAQTHDIKAISIKCIFILKAFAEFATVVASLILGIRLLRNRRRHAAEQCYILIMLNAIEMLTHIMLYGASLYLIFPLVMLILLLAFSTYLDPTLREERQVQRSLYGLEAKQEAELGDMQGRDLSGKSYIILNFFNAFWIFVLCSFLGLCIELMYQFALHGEYMSRAGMLFGPFSPIYGFGGLLLTILLNRYYKKNFILILIISALFGGAFEYLVSFFLEYAFGIVAWDYSGDALNINGRTSAYYMVLWAFLGLAWIKLLLPMILKIINKINWKWRYTVTTVAFVFMLVNGVMSLMSFDFWYERQAGQTPQTAVELFFAQHFDDEFMSKRFETMTVHTKPSTRIG